MIQNIRIRKVFYNKLLRNPLLFVLPFWYIVNMCQKSMPRGDKSTTVIIWRTKENERKSLFPTG